MKASGSLVFSFLVLCVLAGASLPSMSAASPDFECILSCERDTYPAHEAPGINVRIINRTSKEAIFMGSLDGSSRAGRFPHCLFEVLDASGKVVVPLNFSCGNMNRLRVEDFATVPAGHEFDPLDRTKGYFYSHYYLFRPFPAAPGVYTVRFSYSTISTKLEDYFGDERLDSKPVPGLLPPDPALRNKIQGKFDRLQHVELKSNEIKITILPK